MIRASIVGIIVVATAAMARPPTSDLGPNNDPNQIVCVKHKEIGSRLATRRVCRTRAEWREHHMQARQVVEKVQNFKPTQGN